MVEAIDPNTGKKYNRLQVELTTFNFNDKKATDY